MERPITIKAPSAPLLADQLLVDAKQLAIILGVKEGWVRQNMRIIPHTKLKRLVRFNPDVVKEHFKSMMV